MAAFLACGVDHALHVVPVSEGRERTHLRARRIGKIDAQGPGPFEKKRKHQIEHTALDEQAGARDAGLAGSFEDADQHRVHGRIEARIRENDMRQTASPPKV